MKRKPVIMHVLHSLDVGGAEMLAARLARRLSSEFQFVFACLDSLGSMGRALQEEGFAVEVLKRRAGLDLACVRGLARAAARHSVNAIHAHQYTPFFYSRAPGWAGVRPPVLFTEHGRVFPDLPNRKRMLFNRVFLRSIDQVVAVGQSVKQALISNEGISADRVQVIYNGVCSDDFTADAKLREQVRGELNLPRDAMVAIQVARLDSLKDHATAIRTAERVRKELPNFRLLLVGEGPERSMIEREIAQRGLESSVTLMGLRTDVRRLLSAADLFLLTSISEGIPVTLIEAMFAGLPIVSTNVGGVPEVIIDGESGYLAAAGDDAGLAEKILAANGSINERTLLAQRGMQRAQDLFSESEMHRSYAKLYEDMSVRRSAVRSIA